MPSENPKCSDNIEFEWSLHARSYHARHVFRGWLKAEMYRLLTQSSSPATWLEECGVFYNHLRNRGAPNGTYSA